jgi:plasmid stabilization system protein ParE
MAYLVRLPSRALRDPEAIYESIHAESSTLAFAWFNALSEAIYSLEKSPNRGAATPENESYRQIFHGRYRIIYKVDERGKSVGIVHIRHGAMDAFEPAGREGDEI